MSLINSLFAGVSGLRNHQSMMDVIGNNIANVNSIGYKGSRVTFSDTFNQFVKAGTNPTETSGGTNTFQIGLGMKINSIDRNWTQGTFERTGIVTDMALQGSGMFVVKSDGQNYYTRAGAFIFDADGKLVNPQNGAIVQGKVANEDGVIPAGNTLEDIQIDNNLRLPAIATTHAKWGGNLSSKSTITRSENVVQTGNIVPGVPSSIDTKIYDDDGKEYKLTATYQPTANPNEYNINWEVFDGTTSLDTGTFGPIQFEDPDADGRFELNAASKSLFKDADGENIANITVGTKINFMLDPTKITQNAGTKTLSSAADTNREPNIVNGTVTVFDSLGNSHTLTLKFTKTANNSWNWNAEFPDGSVSDVSGESGTMTFNSDGSIQGITPNPPSITFTPIGGAEAQTVELDFGTGLTGISQTSVSSSISALSQNGSASATLSNINVDQYGNIVGVFSNGYSRTLAQVMTATFSNLNGLTSVGDNMFSVSANSGDPLYSALGEESGTTLQSGALEQSNVDLSEEFTKMIVSQRGFQANARVITTADSLLQEITNLVR